MCRAVSQLAAKDSALGQVSCPIMAAGHRNCNVACLRLKQPVNVDMMRLDNGETRRFVVSKRGQMLVSIGDADEQSIGLVLPTPTAEDAFCHFQALVWRLASFVFCPAHFVTQSNSVTSAFSRLDCPPVFARSFAGSVCFLSSLN